MKSVDAKTKIANCAVLPSEADGTEGYVRKLTPFLTRKEEIQNDSQYQDGAIDKQREKSTASTRKQNSIRPI